VAAHGGADGLLAEGAAFAPMLVIAIAITAASALIGWHLFIDSFHLVLSLLVTMAAAGF
jgi:hypothetical protein